MKIIDAFCNECDSEFTIKLVDSEASIKYCPVCSSPIGCDEDALIAWPRDSLYEGWED